MFATHPEVTRSAGFGRHEFSRHAAAGHASLGLTLGAVLVALATCGGVYGTAPLFAVRVGFRDRHHLARALARDGLPALEELAAWVRTAAWVMHSEQYGTPLHRLAIQAGIDPAICYRTVRRLTSANWGEVRERGVAWVLQQLRARCRIRAALDVRRGADGTATG